MLNFTVKPGESFTIGDDIRVVVLGGTANNIKVMVDAPKKYNIVRGKVLERVAKEKKEEGTVKTYYPEPALSKEEITRLIAKQQREKQRAQG